MKKVILFILLAGFLTTANAQKKKGYEKKAEAETAYVTAKMSLNKDKATFLHDVLVDKYASAAKQIHGKELPKEEKQAIRKEGNKAAQIKLSEQFSKAEIKEINSYIKEYNANKKK